jgi:2,3-bisphosphoglycerate-independent phosphoglycerate mutase
MAQPGVCRARMTPITAIDFDSTVRSLRDVGIVREFLIVARSDHSTPIGFGIQSRHVQPHTLVSFLES